jgi:hypothetical protein
MTAAHGRSCVCEKCWRRSTRNRRPREAAKAEAIGWALSAATIREVITYTHPDLWPGRVEAATKLTQKLLAALEQARELERAA